MSATWWTLPDRAGWRPGWPVGGGGIAAAYPVGHASDRADQRGRRARAGPAGPRTRCGGAGTRRRASGSRPHVTVLFPFLRRPTLERRRPPRARRDRRRGTSRSTCGSRGSAGSRASSTSRPSPPAPFVAADRGRRRRASRTYPPYGGAFDEVIPHLTSPSRRRAARRRSRPRRSRHAAVRRAG